MTAALAKDTLQSMPELMSKVVNLLADIGRMAGRRNDVIHGMWGIDHPAIFPSLFPASSPRLSKKNIPQELNAILHDLTVLQNRIVRVQAELKAAIEEQGVLAGPPSMWPPLPPFGPGQSQGLLPGLDQPLPAPEPTPEADTPPEKP